MPAWVPTFAKLVVSFLVIGAAIYLLDWNALRHALSLVSALAFVLAVLLILPEFVVLGYRWIYIAETAVSLPASEHLRRYFVATFLNAFTPGQIGGDVYRFITFRKDTSGSLEAALLLLRERIVGVVGFSVFYLLCLVGYLVAGTPDGFELPQLLIFAGAALGAGLVGYCLTEPILTWLLSTSLATPFRRLRSAASLLARATAWGSLRELFRLQSLSFLGCAGWTLAVIVIARDLDIQVSVFAVGMVAILTDLLRQIPITIQGIGVREALFAYLLSLFGVPPEAGFVVGLASYLALTVGVLIVGGIGAVMPVRQTGPA